MATNGKAKKVSGKKGLAKVKPPSIKRRALPKPTAAQLRAMREYVRMTGHKIDPKRIAKIIAQWQS
jgi:hypothetical protein